MGNCRLAYIPQRLHNSVDQKQIEQFYLSDVLYRRVTVETLINPYATITLADISHNIGTVNRIEISKRNDVLFSILEEEDVETYDREVITLKIISLNDRNHYDKTFYCSRHEDLKVRLLLLHSPEKCMFPHAVFRFFIYDSEEKEVTIKNYKRTLGKRKYKYLRDLLRQELALMVIREAISQKDWGYER